MKVGMLAAQLIAIASELEALVNLSVSPGHIMLHTKEHGDVERVVSVVVQRLGGVIVEGYTQRESARHRWVDARVRLGGTELEVMSSHEYIERQAASA